MLIEPVTQLTVHAFPVAPNSASPFFADAFHPLA
jgi:hypothetical protein